MSAYGVANVLTTVFAVVLLGLNTALSTLVSQSYGLGDMELCRAYIGRGRVVVTLAFLPVALLLFFSEKYFLMCGLDNETASEAVLYVRLSLIYMYIHINFDISRIAVNSFGQSKQIMITFIVTIVFHPLWNYLFIEYLNMKLYGAALAVIPTYSLNLLVLHLLILQHKSMS